MSKQRRAGKNGKWCLVLMMAGILMMLGTAVGFAEEAVPDFLHD